MERTDVSQLAATTRSRPPASGIMGGPFRAQEVGVPADTPDTQEVLTTLAETGKLYEQYLRLSEIAQLGRLSQLSDTPVAAEPPPTNLPLTLTIQTGA